MAVDPLQEVSSTLLKDIVFNLTGHRATLSPEKPSWVTGLVANEPTMWQVVLCYMIPVAIVK